MSGLLQPLVAWAEAGRLPDVVVRTGIRRLLAQRLREVAANDIEAASGALNAFVNDMRAAPIAPLPERANEQHYEVPAAFYALTLGQHRKYSCCHFATPHDSLDDAEARALRITCERAEIRDGMRILELGCGWGSLSLWIAEQYPAATLTAVSNSASQRAYIERIAEQRGLDNLTVITADMNDFDTDARFDRVVSVEMFEHMRNYERLLRRIHGWLQPGGRLFMHIFCHRLVAYAFEDRGSGDWMSRHFFTGGIMPSADLPLRFQQHLTLRNQWRWSGRHYQRTANAWLAKLDRNRDDAMPVLAATYGDAQANLWLQRWRLFFMACAELFGYRDGNEWYVSHYLFERVS